RRARRDRLLVQLTRLGPLAELDLSTAADAASEHAEAVDGCWPVPVEAAPAARRSRLRVLVQCACSVPSRCSSAFEVRCSAGSVELSVRLVPGTYGYGVPPPAGKTYASPLLPTTVTTHLGGTSAD